MVTTRLILPVTLAAAVTVPSSSAIATGGTFVGKTNQGKSIQMHAGKGRLTYFALAYRCRGVRGVTGRTALNDVRITKRRLGAFLYSGMSYSDDKRSDNGRVWLEGVFAASGKSIRGRYRTHTPRCGYSGWITYSARALS